MSKNKKLGIAVASELPADAELQVIPRTPELLGEVIRLLAEVFDVRTARFRLLPAAFWRAIDPQVLVVFATATARWGIVTVELVEWLRERIRRRKAIGIGAGNGDLGFHLGIPRPTVSRTAKTLTRSTACECSATCRQRPRATSACWTVSRRSTRSPRS